MGKYKKINFDLWIIKFISALLPLLLNIYLYLVSGNIFKLSPAAVISELYFIAIMLSLDSLQITSNDSDGKGTLFLGASAFIVFSTIAYGHVVDNNIRNQLSFASASLAIPLFAGCLAVNLRIQYKRKTCGKPIVQNGNGLKKIRSDKYDETLLLNKIRDCMNDGNYDEALNNYNYLPDKYKNGKVGNKLKRDLEYRQSNQRRLEYSFNMKVPNLGAQGPPPFH